ELRPGEHAADRVGLSVGLQGESLVEAGTRLGALGDGQRDPGECEQEAREQCGEGRIAHANAGAGPPKRASARWGVMPTPVKGEAPGGGSGRRPGSLARLDREHGPDAAALEPA